MVGSTLIRSYGGAPGTAALSKGAGLMADSVPFAVGSPLFGGTVFLGASLIAGNALFHYGPTSFGQRRDGRTQSHGR